MPSEHRNVFAQYADASESGVPAAIELVLDAQVSLAGLVLY